MAHASRHEMTEAMKAIDQLRNDHAKIIRMLDYYSESLAPFSQPSVYRALQFFNEWMVRIHHVQQEGLFDLLLVQAPDVSRGIVQAMRKEHAVAEAYLRNLVGLIQRGDEDSTELLRRHSRAFIELVRAHVQKEAQALFPLCERLIPPSMDNDLLERFEKDTEGRLSKDALQAHLHIAENPGDTMMVRTKRADPTPVASPAHERRIQVIDAKTLSEDEKEKKNGSGVVGKSSWVFYDQGGHRNLRLHDFGQGLAVQANTFLIVHNGEGMLLDPGGPKVFPNVLAETMMTLDQGTLKWLFLSHQDPDICTALNAWLMETKADALVSRLWTRFLPHFGIDKLMQSRLRSIPDEGMRFDLGGTELLILPAHFLHSCGNFQIYDPVSKILFSGDLGASVGATGIFVQDFDAHIPFMRGFHQRYMGGNAALSAWADMVEQLDVQMIAPQHGLAINGPHMVTRFLDWCRGLQCGIDFATRLFQIPQHKDEAS